MNRICAICLLSLAARLAFAPPEPGVRAAELDPVWVSTPALEHGGDVEARGFWLERAGTSRPASSLPASDPASPGAREREPGSASGAISSVSFEGLSASVVLTGPLVVAGDIGLRHYVQVMDGSRFAAFDRSGAPVGPARFIRGLWPSGSCNNNDRGNPSVAYDAIADRWILSFLGRSTAICIAVSESDDPLGAYHLYELDIGVAVSAHDLGVWPDALAITVPGPPSWLFALERARMLTGDSARAFGGYSADNGASFPVPVRYSGGPLPPSGKGPLYLNRISPSVSRPSGAVMLTRLKLNWNLPTATFTPIWSADGDALDVAEDLACGGPMTGCIAQSGTANLLSAADPPMRSEASYRRFDSAERIVHVFGVPRPGTSRPTLTWLELASPYAQDVWADVQQGQVRSDTASRWLGAAAMNSAAEIGLAYTAASPDVAPELRYAVWPRGDGAGGANVESVFWPGMGAQITGTLWNQRASLAVDPMDGCGFWTTGQYLASTGATMRQSRFGWFMLAECAPAFFSVRVTPDTADVCAGASLSILADVFTTTTATTPVTLTGALLTMTAPIGIGFVAPPPALGAPFGAPLTVTIGPSSTAGIAIVGVVGNGPGTFTATVELRVWTPITVAPGTLTATVGNAPLGFSTGPVPTATKSITYQVYFQWAEAGQAAAYLLEVADNPGFVAPVLALTTTTSAPSPLMSLRPLAVYYWRVRAANVCGTGPLSSAGSFRPRAFLWLPLARR